MEFLISSSSEGLPPPPQFLPYPQEKKKKSAESQWNTLYGGVGRGLKCLQVQLASHTFGDQLWLHLVSSCKLIERLLKRQLYLLTYCGSAFQILFQRYQITYVRRSVGEPDSDSLTPLSSSAKESLKLL